MSFDVFSFGPDCDGDVGTAFSGTGKTCAYADFTTESPKRVLKRAKANIKGGNYKSVVCSVSPPSPLQPLELLSELQQHPPCPFYLYAKTQAEFDAQVPDKQIALNLGATDFLIGASTDQLREQIETVLSNTGDPGLV